MDPAKKRTLIEWWNAVSGQNIHNFVDLRDGKWIASVLLKGEGHLIPPETDLSSSKHCLMAVKEYLQSFCEGADDLINFELIVNPNAQHELIEMEMAKLLLALFGCVIQDRCRDTFIQPALELDVESQQLITAILRPFVTAETGVKLQPGFDDVLKQKAARSSIVTFTNSPMANTSGISIASPMRNLSLSSPVPRSPLGALMSSPQLTQKAALRQKIYEIRKLEAKLRTEQHLRGEMELNLQDKAVELQGKEKKLRELQRQLTDIRKLQDRIDELEPLEMANERLQRDKKSLQDRLLALQNVKDHTKTLRKENSEYWAELQKARNQLQVLQSIENDANMHYAKCFKLELEIRDLKASLELNAEENASLKTSIEELRNMNEAASMQCQTLKNQKEDLEERLATQIMEMTGPSQVSTGETMNVVTEKKLVEFQAEYERKCNDLFQQNASIARELESEQKTKKAFEDRYVEMKKETDSMETQINKLNFDLCQCHSAMVVLEASLKEANEQEASLISEVKTLETSQNAVMQIELELRSTIGEREATLLSLKDTLSSCQTDLELARKELDVSTEISEKRRQKLTEKELSLTQTENELKIWKSKSQEMQEALDKIEIDRADAQKRNKLTVEDLTQDLDDLKKTLNTCREESCVKIADMESKLNNERSKNESNLLTINGLEDELKKFKASAEEEKKLLEVEVAETKKEKNNCTLEIHRLALELSSAKDSYTKKIDKLEMKFQEKESEVATLKSAKAESAANQDNLTEEIGKLNRTIQEQKGENDQLHGVAKNLKLSQTELLNLVEKLRLTVSQYEQELKVLKDRLDSEVSQSASDGEEKAKMISALQAQLETERKKYSTEKLQFTEQIQKMEREMENRIREFHEIRSSLEEAQSSLEAKLSSSKMDYENQMSGLRTENQTIGEQLKELKTSYEKEVESLKLIIKELEQKLVNSEQAKIDLEIALKEKEAMVTSMSEQLEYLQGLEKSQTVTIGMLQTDSAAMKNLVTEKDKIKAELACSIREKDQEIEDKDKEINRVTALLSETSESYNRIKEGQKVLKEDFEQLVNAKSAAEESLEKFKLEHEALVSELQNKISKNEEYWKCQIEHLSDEYDKELIVLKNNASSHAEEIKETFENQIEQMTIQNSICIASYRDKITGLEKVLTEKEVDFCRLTEEKTDLEAKHGKHVEESKKEIETMIGMYETQLDELRVELTETREESKRLADEYQVKVDRLNAEVEEQRVNYQQMLCDMEGKLGGETVMLRERLSQLKCQYDTLIETKEKETSAKVSELENTVSEYVTKLREQEAMYKKLQEENKESLKQIEELDKAKIQLDSEKTEISDRNAELEKTACGLQQECTEFEQQRNTLQDEIDSVRSELDSQRTEAKQAAEETRREKCEADELRRQLEYNQERNDTLTAELSSNQQQLAAVEEEKRVLEVEMSSIGEAHRLQLEELNKQLDSRCLEIEEIERQLQASHTSLEIVQKSQTDLQNLLKSTENEQANMEMKNRDLEKRVLGYMEREKRIGMEHQHQIDKAAELNGTLQRQIDTKTKELQKVNEEYNKEVKLNIEERSQFERELQTMREEKTAYEIDAAQLQEVKNELQASEEGLKKLKKIHDQYNYHYNMKKETISSLEKKLAATEQSLKEMTSSKEKMMEEVAPLREKLDAERMRNKTLSSEVRTLSAQNDLADRRLREYRDQVEKGNAVFLGDNTEFKRMLALRESAEDASFMEDHPPAIPRSMSERRESAVLEDSESLSETITPNTRRRSRMSKSVSSATVSSNPEKDTDTISIGSTSSLAYRLRSRESAVSLNRSFTSMDSCKSNSSVPRGTGGIFHCEDEPVEMQWDRLGELQRRNTLCPAHLKTSYPVETQIYKPTRFREDALRESTMGNKTLLERVTGSGRKRKQDFDPDSSETDSLDGKNKQSKTTGCAYQKPGPPTPAHQRRNSGKGSRSPGSQLSKGSNSPRTPVYRRTRRTPENSPKRSNAVNSQENPNSGKKATRQNRFAYNNGCSPQSTSSQRQLRRQQAFVQKQPQSMGQNRKPLGTRNFLQTGV